ncbi:hypothetical protein JOM56_008921 [Amanita muscaria]
MADRRMQKDLKDIPSHFFPIWHETLGYERGLPIFRQPPTFSEEGVLAQTAGEYSYQLIRMRVAPPIPASSQLSLSLTGQVELEDNSPPSFHNEYEMESYPAPCQQTPGPSAQSTSSQIYDQPSGEGSSYDDDDVFNPHPHPGFFQEDPYYVYENLAESSAMQEIEEQTYPRAFFTPNVDSSPGSTSTPHNMQWNPSSFGPISSYGQVQYSLDHNGMTPPQTDDTQMAESFWPYGTDLQ